MASIDRLNSATPKLRTFGSIFYWSWNKPQVEVKSFPSEAINPLVANSEGTHIIGGGVSGYLFLAVTCLLFCDDQSLLVSGAEDGCVRVWSLISKAVTCLAFSMDGIHLVSGSEDGMIRVWDTRKRNITRIFRHSKGPVNNVLIVRQPPHLNPSPLSSLNSSAKKHGYPWPPALGKYADSSDESTEIKAFIGSQTPSNYLQDASNRSSLTMMNQIKELQQQGSSAASEIEMERLKLDCSRIMQMIQQRKKMYKKLHQYCVSKLLDEELVENVQKQQK